MRKEEIVYRGVRRQQVSFGLCDDRHSTYIGFQTPKGDVGCEYLNKAETASLGAKLMNFSQDMVDDPKDEEGQR